jgi:hypothetical protein
MSERSLGAEAMSLLTLVFTGLLAGSLFMGTFGVKRAVAQLDAPSALRVRHNLIRSLRVLMPILMILTVGSTIGEAVLRSASERFAAIVGAVAAVAVLAVTLSVHSPLNRVFLRWTPEGIPANGPALIVRWNFWDSVRVGLALAAFVATAYSVVAR